MLVEAPQAWWQDPDVLTAKANALLDKEREDEPDAQEEALRSAFRRVSTDLDIVLKQQQNGKPLTLPSLSVQRDEKLAAFLMLAKYTLHDLAHLPREIRDIELAHHALAIYAEILFRHRAIAGLITLFEFTQEQMRTGNSYYWRNVGSHCLMLLALMEDERAQVVEFLAGNPAARKQLKGLVSFTRPQVIGALLRAGAERERPTSIPEPPMYIRLFEHYDPNLPVENDLGISSFMLAQHQIIQALHAEDYADVIRWFVDGSSAAAREVLRRSHAALPRRTYRHLLEAIITNENPHPVRQAAVVLELSAINREEKPEGGSAEINRLLFGVAMNAQRELAGVARLAVRQMKTVRNLDGLLVVIEQAPQQKVAEEAICMMKELRRLLMVEPLMKQRPKLEPCYEAARTELLDIQKIMEALWKTESDAEIHDYVVRLEAMKAYPELETVAELAERRGDLHRLRLATGAG